MRTTSLPARVIAIDGVLSIFTSKYIGLREMTPSLPGSNRSTSLIKGAAKGRKISVLIILKAVCALAIWRAISWAGDTAKTSFMNNPIKVTKRMLPIRLNNTWANATRFAVTFARQAAMIAVMQVPILSPRSTGIAPSKGIKPWLAMAIKIPIVAELDWISTVITIPTPMPRIGLWENLPIKSTKPWYSRRGKTDCPIILMPSIRIPNPRSTCPRYFPRRRLASNCIANPIAKIKVT